MKKLILSITTLVLMFVTFSSFTQNKAISIQTIQTIDAPQNEVYNLLISLERFSEWSPFLVADPEQKTHVTGTDSQVGSAYHWEGVGEESLGTETLSEVKENTYVLMNVDLQKPQKSTCVFEYLITKENGKTIVTQNFSIPCNGFEKFMMKLFGVEKEMTEVNTLGMDRLKTLAEKDFALTNNQ